MCYERNILSDSNWPNHQKQRLWGDDVNVFNPYRKYEDFEIWAHEGS